MTNVIANGLKSTEEKQPCLKLTLTTLISPRKINSIKLSNFYAPWCIQ